MTNSVLLVIFILLQFYPPNIPAVPATVPDPDFPLRVQLLATSAVWYRHDGVGRGNIIGTKLGFDFVESCDQDFSQNRDPNQVYQARWKKQDLRLEILLQEIGSTHVQRCELRTTLRDQPYEIYTAKRQAPISASNATPLILALPFATPTPDYPLRVQLWLTRAGEPIDVHPTGLGNISHRPKIGFSFVNDHCDPRLTFSRDPDVFYQARWKEQDRRLEILLQEIGTTYTYACELSVTVKSGPNNLHYSPKANLDPPLPSPGG